MTAKRGIDSLLTSLPKSIWRRPAAPERRAPSPVMAPDPSLARRKHIGRDDLDAFVTESDRHGGPGAEATTAYWQDLVYTPAVQIDQDLSPFSADYLDQQLALYEEISGRTLDQSVNEDTSFDISAHVAARNPYNHPDPALLANHLVRLCTAFKLAKVTLGAELLDMGCGWGLSSEVAAYLGLNVHAVDINAKFVELVRQRSAQLRWGITAEQSSFDEFHAEKTFDLVLFYECLHHAVRPWDVVDSMYKLLNNGGKLILCGEPVNEIWWPSWGMRLDPLSLYCIRKHGWFESGWSRAFISECLQRAHFDVVVTESADPEVGMIIVATKNSLLPARWLVDNAEVEGGVLDGDYLVAGGRLSLRIQRTPPADRLYSGLRLHNFRAKPVRVAWRIDGGEPQSMDLPPGETTIPLTAAGKSTIEFESETWVPALEIGNADQRSLAFQISGVWLGH